MTELFNWLLSLINGFAQAYNWLVTPLPYIDMTPLSMLTFGGLVIIIGLLLIRLIIGG